MRRLFLIFALAGLGLAVPTASMATLLPPRSTQVTGKLTSSSAYSFTIQTPGRAVGVLNALARAATRVTALDTPYVWGGGHAQAGIASVGIKGGPGANGKRHGFDCSGAVAAVLEAGGLWPAGASVPSDAGVIRYLLRRKEIVRGAGSGPGEVTLYDKPGVHIFMNINGRFFGTSDGGRGGDAKGGAGWLDDGAWDSQSPSFRRYHFASSALKATTNAGYTLAFQFGPGVALPSGLPAGTNLTVVYKTTNIGTMVAQAVTPVGLITATATVQAVDPTGTSLTVTTATGETLTFPVAADTPLQAELLDGQLAAGETLSISYISTPLTLVSVTITAVGSQTTTTTTTSLTPAPTGPPMPTQTSPSAPYNSGGAGF